MHSLPCRDGEHSGQESNMALWEQERKALEKSSPDVHGPAPARRSTTTAFHGPKYNRTAEKSSGNTGLGLPRVLKETPGEWLRSDEP